MSISPPMSRSSGLIALVLCSVVAHATDTRWTSRSGAWMTSENWSAGLPTPTSNAIFDLATPQYTVWCSESALIMSGRLVHQRGSVLFAGEAPIELLYSSAFSPSLEVGTVSAEVATMTLELQAGIRAPTVDVSTIDGGVGVLAVRNGGMLEVEYGMRVGVRGNGSLLTNSPIWVSTLEIGVAALSTGLVTGSSLSSPPSPTEAASRVDVAGQCTVGVFGAGELQIGASGMTCGSLVIGKGVGSIGTLIASGSVVVNGRATVAERGIGAMILATTLHATGGVTMGRHGPSSQVPSDPYAIATVTLAGGGILSGGSVEIGVDGKAIVNISGGASIESTERIVRGGLSGSPAISILLPAVPPDSPNFAAPTLVGLGCAVTVEGIPDVGSVWHISHSFDGTLASVSITTDPGKGNEWRLISCANDRFLALLKVGAPSPDVCATTSTPVIVPDEIADAGRRFGQGGIAVGDGWYAVGSPGAGGGVDIFRSVNGIWLRDATLVSPEAGRTIGAGIAAQGNRLATRTSDGARAFVFVREAGTWKLEGNIELNAEPPSQHSRTIALEGTTVVVGDPYFDAGSLANVGRARVYTFDGSNWVLQAVVNPDVAILNLRFGSTVSVSGAHLAVGSLSGDLVALFERIDQNWSPAGFVPSASVGGAVALSGNDLITGPSPRFWRAQQGLWSACGSGSVGSETTNMHGKICFDGATAAYLGPTTVSTYKLDPDGSWRIGDSITLPSSGEWRWGVAVGGALTCVARSASVLVYGAVPPSACRADFNGDGDVGGVDLTFILTSWGATPAGDLNGDGVTDATDLAFLLSGWGSCP